PLCNQPIYSSLSPNLVRRVLDFDRICGWSLRINAYQSAGTVTNSSVGGSVFYNHWFFPGVSLPYCYGESASHHYNPGAKRKRSDLLPEINLRHFSEPKCLIARRRNVHSLNPVLYGSTDGGFRRNVI